MKKSVNFGVIGCGLMGREFASASLRWAHLTGGIPAPRIVGVCDPDAGACRWFAENVPTVEHVTGDYRALLARDDVEAVYCAVPHNLHEEIYCAVIRAGKHLLGEKPFGIDRAANANILRAVAEHPELVVRCASEFPYFPGCQQLIRWIEENKFGRIIEVRAGFYHSSDMDLNKPVNWKRRVETNGAYGCMGDLGVHTQHVPFRAGWRVKNVFAKLSNIVTERPDGKGGTAPCDTWDNAVLVCDAETDGYEFPMILETKRMSPGSTNEWYITVHGLSCSAKFTTNDPNAFFYTQSWDHEQAWCRVGIGCKPLFPTITGGIFEFGFSDAILQMWAAYMLEMSGEPAAFGCFTPEETRLSHSLLDAACLSHEEGRKVDL